eukprot:COSAG06_NODE_58161_length_278_cov_0.564246_1_plen_75_part_01
MKSHLGTDLFDAGFKYIGWKTGCTLAWSHAGSRTSIAIGEWTATTGNEPKYLPRSLLHLLRAHAGICRCSRLRRT